MSVVQVLLQSACMFGAYALKITIPPAEDVLQSIYTPIGHPMIHNASMQGTLERFKDGHWVFAPGEERKDLKSNELFVRHFPVETQFFDSYGGLPCHMNAFQIGGEDEEPKFLCGSPADLNRKDKCRIFSIGSNGQTSFEEFIKEHAPRCEIDVFDPTLDANKLEKVQSLEKKNIFTFHPFGLGSSNEIVPDVGEVRTLMSLYDRAQTQWVDYLKIDCEDCEFTALPKFIDDSLNKYGYVPATQIQIEIHVAGWNADTTKRWALQGIDKVSPYRFENSNTNARRLVALLEKHGFIPFHIDMTRHEYLCCGVEYTFLNTKAPKDRLPAIS